MISSVSPTKIAALRANLFAPAHAAINDWQTFPWHRDRTGAVQVDKVQSSQALAIDVFGAIASAPEASRNAVLDALAQAAGLPPGGPWSVELEWCDPENLLCEPRQTQVDALIASPRAIMVIECKFTETGGACSQTKRLTKGPGAGHRQCNGRYELQRNPANGVEAHCTLSGKGIGYWSAIPDVFDLDPAADHVPCPFKDEAFQWMRNIVLADALGRRHGKVARCLIAYAAGGNFPTETKAGGGEWLPPFVEGARAPFMVSYQGLADMAASADPDQRWPLLAAWIDRKVGEVGAQRAAAASRNSKPLEHKVGCNGA